MSILVLAGLMTSVLGSAWAFETDGLVLYAPMDEDRGNVVADISPTAAEGSLSGDATWTPDGKVGGAVVFAGDGHVEFVENSALSLTDTLTMMAWILPTASPGDANLFGRRNASNAGGYTMQWTAERVETWVHFGGWTGTRGLQAVVPAIGEWHFVAGGYDGANIFQYVDGQRDAGIAASGNVDEITDVFRIGQAQTGLVAMPGIIDEVAVYNRALTFEEVEDIRVNGMFAIAVKAQGSAATRWARLKSR
jgi:hypothetical protein